jgi:hypothetical protein
LREQTFPDPATIAEMVDESLRRGAIRGVVLDNGWTIQGTVPLEFRTEVRRLLAEAILTAFRHGSGHVPGDRTGGTL